MLLLISIMLSVISGVTAPGNGARSSKASMSGDAGARSKSDRFTSCSSSSTPIVSGDERLNSGSGILVLLLFYLLVFGKAGFTRAGERDLGQDRRQHFQDHGHGRQRRQWRQGVEQVDARAPGLL